MISTNVQNQYSHLPNIIANNNIFCNLLRNTQNQRQLESSWATSFLPCYTKFRQT